MNTPSSSPQPPPPNDPFRLYVLIFPVWVHGAHWTGVHSSWILVLTTLPQLLTFCLQLLPPQLLQANALVLLFYCPACLPVLQLLLPVQLFYNCPAGPPTPACQLLLPACINSAAGVYFAFVQCLHGRLPAKLGVTRVSEPPGCQGPGLRNPQNAPTDSIIDQFFHTLDVSQLVPTFLSFSQLFII